MIKNLLFDLGGVIMDIDRMNCVRAFQRLGFTDVDKYLGDYGQKDFFLNLESGAIDETEFYAKVHAHLPSDVTDSQIKDALNEFLTGIPAHRLHQLAELREKYPVYLLSNTNPVMWNSKIMAEITKEGHPIDYYFNGIVTSYEARCCKPDRRIFDYAAEKFNINPDETLFFDDSQSNVDAARSYGYHAIKVNPGDEFAVLLKNYCSVYEPNC